MKEKYLTNTFDVLNIVYYIYMSIYFYLCLYVHATLWYHFLMAKVICECGYYYLHDLYLARYQHFININQKQVDKRLKKFNNII